MERTYTADAVNKIGKEIQICGWVDVRRDHGRLIFLDIRDMTGIIQGVINPKVSAEAHTAAEELRSEFVVQAKGKVNRRPENLINPKMATGTVEVEITDLVILARAEPLPFELDANLNIDTYLDNQPLTLRSRKNRAIFRLQAAVAQSFREYLRSINFTEFQSPKIVAQAAEGGAEVFRVKYFDHNAYLAQSPQLYKQIMVGVFERVFTVTSVYRAEPHSTTRHINEYVSLDMEMGFIKDHTDVMKVLNGWIAYLVELLQKNNAADIKLLEIKLPAVPKEIP